MLEWLYYYTIFALSGAIVSWWSIFMPALYLLCKEDCHHAMLRSKFLSSIVWIAIAFVAIPMIAIPLLSRKTRIAFIHNLTLGFLKH